MKGKRKIDIFAGIDHIDLNKWFRKLSIKTKRSIRNKRKYRR